MTNKRWVEIELQRRAAKLHRLLDSGCADVTALLADTENLACCSRLHPLVQRGYETAAQKVAESLSRITQVTTEEQVSEVEDLMYLKNRIREQCDRFLLRTKRIMRPIYAPNKEVDRLIWTRKKKQASKIMKLFKFDLMTLPLFLLSSLLSYYHGRLETSRFSLFSRIITQVTQQNTSTGLKHKIRHIFILELPIGLLTFTKQKISDISVNKFARALKTRLFAQVIHQDISFFEKRDMDEISSLILSTDQLASSVIHLPSNTFDILVRIVSSVAFVFSKSKKYGFILCFLLGFQYQAIYGMDILRDYLEALSIKMDPRGSFKEVFSALKSKHKIRALKLLGREDVEVEVFEQSLIEYDSFQQNGRFWFSVFSPLTLLLENATEILALYLGSTLDPNSELNIGQTYAQARATFSRIQFLYSILDNVSESVLNPAEKVVNLLHALPGTTSAELSYEETKSLELKFDEILVENVLFKYPGSETTCLVGVNLCAKAGDRVAICGESGAGKSSLFAVMTKLYKPDEGKILVDGVDLAVISSKYFHETIGVVSQEVFLPRRSIFENFQYFLETCTFFTAMPFKEQSNYVYELLNDVQLHSLVGDKSRFPQGLETDLGPDCEKLSGGQRQRLNLALILARKPKVLFLDEFTSALDEDLQQALLDTLDILHKKAGDTIMFHIAHRITSFRDCNKVVVMSRGKVVEHGEIKSLAATESKFATFLEDQEALISAVR